jgi:hypothetical protein
MKILYFIKIFITAIIAAAVFSCSNTDKEQKINWNATKITITTAEQLREFATLVNNRKNFNGKIITLANDIDLNGSADNQWTPPGKYSHGNGTSYTSFDGTFDGKGHIVRGLYIDNENSYQGLFGIVGSKGLIRNLGIVDAYVKGGMFVGGLAGSNEGMITNCYVTGNVLGDGSYVGGLVGLNGGLFDGLNGGDILISYAAANVVSVGEFAGGLVGYNILGEIKNSYSTGSVTAYNHVGGLAGGIQLCTISNSYATGSVVERKIDNSYVGGLVGYYSEGGEITNCYYDRETSGRNDVKGTPKTTDEMKRQTTYIDWDFTNIWAINSAKNNGYPYLSIIDDEPIAIPKR